METHINFYASEETAVFQKPIFEWVWKLCWCIEVVILLVFQKPAFEWVWKLHSHPAESDDNGFRSPHLSGYGNLDF